MRKFLSLLILTVMFFSVGFAQKSTVITLNAKKNSFKVKALKNTGFTIENSISELNLNAVSFKKGNFMTLENQGLIKIFEEGMPNIPVISKLIEVPQGAEVELIIKSFDEEIIKLSDYGITDKIQPALRSQSKSEDDVPFRIKENIYKTDDFINNKIAEYVYAGQLRALRLGRIEIRPIQYNPVTNTLRVLNNLVVEVNFKNADIAATEALKRKYSSPNFNSMLGGITINFDTNANKDLITQEPTHMVIVSDRMFEAQLAPYIAWKIKKGFKVTVGYTDDIGSQSAIKTYLQDIYEGSNPMSFVLFVGDHEQIEAFDGNSGSHVTDLRYCEYTGDDLPEVFYGRFSAQTTAHLQPQIDKTLMYEQYTMNDPSYLERVFLVAGDDSGNEMTFGNGAIWYADNYYFNSSNNITSFTRLQPLDNSAVSAEIFQEMNNGLGFANYTAHCGSSGWSTPSFSTSDVNSLTNNEKYGLWVGNCCLSVKFDDSECFGEAALRKANGGAIGDIGGSNSTYWDEDYWWGIGLKSGTETGEPLYDETDIGTFDGIFHTMANEQDPSTWMITQGQANVCGNLAVEASSSSRKEYYWEIYHLMGDPSVINYMGVPTAMTVTPSPAALMLGMTTLNVSSSPYSYVALSQNGVLIDAKVSDDAGNASLSFASDALSVGDANIVVTCQNRVPYIGIIGVSPANEPYVVLNSYTTDIDPNYGQTISLNVILENVANSGSGYDALNTVATLSLTDPYITIMDGIENYETINAGTTKNINDAFSVTIADNVPDQYSFSFDLEIVGQDGSSSNYTWDATLNMLANAPVISIGDVFITNDANANGILDPAETADINFTITNNGHATAEFDGLLSESSDPNNYLTLGGTNVSGVSLAAGASQDFTFTGASADGATPLGSPVELQIDVTAGASDQYTDVDNQEIIIGIIPIYLISDAGPYTVCTGTFYDTGGEAGEYASNEDETLTFLPAGGEDFVVVEFTEFATEGGYDYLYVHDGPDTSSPQVAGSPFDEDAPMTEAFMGANGLTFHFTSDGSFTRSGWVAEVSCFTATDVPACVENPMPADAASNVFPVNISWSSSMGATSYDVYFGTNVDPYTNTPIPVASTEYSISVDPTTTYYWAVLPSNDIGTAVGCSVWSFTTGAEQHTMTNGTVTTCDAVFYDTGGATGAYQSNEDITMTFLPETAGKMMNIEFVSFATEGGYDYLSVYDAADAANFIGQYDEDDMPPTNITATNLDGALTFVFHSDGSFTRDGWVANMSCVEAFEITFNVTDGTNPIEGATVDFNETTIDTDASGNAVFYVLEGIDIPYTITKTDYYSANGTVDADADKTIDVVLDLIPTYDITFNVTDGTNPIEGATVGFNSTTIDTDVSGEAVFINVPEGSAVAYSVTKTGLTEINSNVDVDGDKTVYVIMTPNSINDLSNNITIVPNPNNGMFVIDFGKLNTAVNIDIITVSGQTIYESNSSANIHKVDLSEHSKGIYFVRISYGLNVYNTKIMIK